MAWAPHFELVSCLQNIDLDLDINYNSQEFRFSLKRSLNAGSLFNDIWQTVDLVRTKEGLEIGGYQN